MKNILTKLIGMIIKVIVAFIVGCLVYYLIDNVLTKKLVEVISNGFC